MRICENCRKPKRKKNIFKNRISGKMICRNCNSKDPSRHKMCCRCGRIKLSKEQTRDGPICAKCYRKDISKHKVCCECKNLRYVAQRTPKGPICSKCYRRPSG